jgi:hypothetical protein
MLIPNVILASASKLVFLKRVTESSILQYHRRQSQHYAKILAGPTKSSKE